MTLQEQYHADHKARLARLGSIPRPVLGLPAKPIPVRGRPRSSVNPVPHYRNMWFWELISLPPKRNTGYTPALQKILEVVAEHYGVSIEEMKNGRRTKKPTHARQVVMYLAREMTPMTLPQIGRYLGGKDHTTIIHGNRVIGSKLLISPMLQRDIEILKARLQ